MKRRQFVTGCRCITCIYRVSLPVNFGLVLNLKIKCRLLYDLSAIVSMLLKSRSKFVKLMSESQIDLALVRVRGRVTRRLIRVQAVIMTLKS